MPTNLPINDIMVILHYLDGKDRDLNKFLSAVYELLGYALQTFQQQNSGKLGANDPSLSNINPIVNQLIQVVLPILLELLTKKIK